MFCCTLRLDPQVFTGSCLVITGQWAGYWCCRRPLGWIQAITATERGRLSFSSPTPPSPGRSRVLLLLALHWPRFSPHPTAELQTNPQQKTSVWRYHTQVCVRGEGGSLPVRLVALLSWAAETLTADLNPSPGVTCCGCQRGPSGDSCLKSPFYNYSKAVRTPSPQRWEEASFNSWGPRTSQHTLSFPLLFSASLPLLLHTLWSSFTLTVTYFSLLPHSLCVTHLAAWKCCGNEPDLPSKEGFFGVEDPR